MFCVCMCLTCEPLSSDRQNSFTFLKHIPSTMIFLIGRPCSYHMMQSSLGMQLMYLPLCLCSNSVCNRYFSADNTKPTPSVFLVSFQSTQIGCNSMCLNFKKGSSDAYNIIVSVTHLLQNIKTCAETFISNT